MGSLQMMDVRMKMRCRASTGPWWGAGQAIPSILHGFGCWRQLWVSGQVLLDTHLDLVTLLGNVFHLGSLGWCHPTSELCPH